MAKTNGQQTTVDPQAHEWISKAMEDGVKPEQALAFMGLGLMQRLNGEDNSFTTIWQESQDGQLICTACVNAWNSSIWPFALVLLSAPAKWVPCWVPARVPPCRAGRCAGQAHQPQRLETQPQRRRQ